ncbi:hypothetical protein YC2023_081477 [Brassica napus]
MRLKGSRESVTYLETVQLRIKNSFFVQEGVVGKQGETSTSWSVEKYSKFLTKPCNRNVPTN